MTYLNDKQHSARSALRLNNFRKHRPRSTVQLTSLITHVFNSLQSGDDLEKFRVAELAYKILRRFLETDVSLSVSQQTANGP
jgi:hypothetical protein